MTSVTVYKRVKNAFFEDNRQVRFFRIEVPVTRENGKCTGISSFFTGEIPWSCSFEETYGEDRKRHLTFKLVPDGGYSPFAHLSVSADVFSSSTGLNYLSGPFIPCKNFGKIVLRGRGDDRINSISCCLQIEQRLRDSEDESATKVVMKFPKALTSGLFNDVTFQVGEKTFPAHRVILSAQSPVFFAMFSQPMKESQEAKVEIEDCSPEAMEILVNFLYSGTLPDISDDIFSQIIHQAHKYQIERLIKVCELRLSRKLNFKTAVETLKVADLYDLKILKHQIANFMKPSRNEIFNTPAWKELEQSNPQLVIQVFKLWLPSASS